MPIIFDNEMKSYIPKQRLQENIKYGTGCHIGAAIYLPAKPYHDRYALSDPVKEKNIAIANEVIKDIANTNANDLTKSDIAPSNEIPLEELKITPSNISTDLSNEVPLKELKISPSYISEDLSNKKIDADKLMKYIVAELNEKLPPKSGNDLYFYQNTNKHI
jgi:hypothetical protein